LFEPITHPTAANIVIECVAAQRLLNVYLWCGSQTQKHQDGRYQPQDAKGNEGERHHADTRWPASSIPQSEAGAV
jgi:hypothetical protein